VFVVGCGVAAFAQEVPVAAPTAGDTPEAHLGKGYDALRQQAYEAAVSEFRAALQLDPSLVWKARFPLADALFELHRSDEARREFENIRHEVGNDPRVLYYLGRLDLDDHNFESAILSLREAVAAKPKPPFPDTAYYLGFAYFKQGDLAAAERWLKEATRLTPRDPRVLYQLGFVYRREGREQDAKKALAASEELRRREDKESLLTTECGKKLDQGPREEANILCEQLYVPNDVQKLTSLGMLYAQHGDLAAALKPFRRAAELSPQDPWLQYYLARTHYLLNQFEQARAPLATAVARYPDLFPLNALYGAVLLRLGEEVVAYNVLHHAQQLNPQDPETTDLLYKTSLNLARKDQSAKHYANSLHYLEEAENLRPQEPDPHRVLAEIYTLTGHLEKAATEKQVADRLSNPSN
jgi:Flp pilus assembly protein TadD